MIKLKLTESDARELLDALENTRTTNAVQSIMDELEEELNMPSREDGINDWDDNYGQELDRRNK